MHQLGRMFVLVSFFWAGCQSNPVLSVVPRVATPSQAPEPIKHGNTLPEITRLAVVMYICCPLPARNVEVLLQETA
jgi:hypothetical protein